MKRPTKLKTTIISAGIATLLVSAVVLFFWPTLPNAITGNDNTAQPPTATKEDGTTKTTRAIQDDVYFDTDPSEWFAVGEDVNWNDQLIVRVERVSVCETLPDDIHDMTELFYYGFDHYQQLVDGDESLTFIDITLQVTCIGLPSGSLYGMSIDEDYCSIASGNMVVTYYDDETDRLTEFIVGGMDVAIQDLSGNSNLSVGAGYYELAVGETARFRFVNIISKDMWEQKDVLLTPMYGRYNTDQMRWLYLEQPHIHLNKDI